MEKGRQGFRTEIILPRSITIPSTKYTPTFSINWSRRSLSICAKTKSACGWLRDSGMPCSARIADTVGRGLRQFAEAEQPLPISAHRSKFGTLGVAPARGQQLQSKFGSIAHFHFARLDCQ